jgi:g-D-glutamyl-meso-diaminopimelate peptidase
MKSSSFFLLFVIFTFWSCCFTLSQNSSLRYNEAPELLFYKLSDFKGIHSISYDNRIEVKLKDKTYQFIVNTPFFYLNNKKHKITALFKYENNDLYFETSYEKTKNFVDFIQENSTNVHTKGKYVVEDYETYTYGMIQEDLAYFVNQYGNYLNYVDVGKSEFGLDLTTLRLGKGKQKENALFLVGNIHGREDYSSKFLMKFLNLFLLSLDGEESPYKNAHKWLEDADIYIMPVANPDGLKIAQGDWEDILFQFTEYYDDILVVETLNEWKANGLGIDLNCSFDDGNHDVKKGGTYKECRASEGFKGDCAAEPSETKAIQEFIEKYQPLITASFHTKGNITFWADQKTHHLFKGIDKKINDEVVRSSGFALSKVSKNPESYACGLENFVRSKYALIGVCVELSYGDKSKVQYPDDLFNELVWDLAWEIPWIYLKNTVKFSKELREINQNYLILEKF